MVISKKKLSLSAFEEVAKLIKALGHDIPIDPRTTFYKLLILLFKLDIQTFKFEKYHLLEF